MNSVLQTLKRLSLGLILIAACAALLLWADLGSRAGSAPEAANRRLRIAVVQYISQPAIDAGRDGILEALAARGYRDGDRVELRRYNAEGDIATANAIAKDVVSSGFDLIVTATTASLQTVANANKTGPKVRHVFGVVSDPYSAGVGIDPADHRQHPPYMTGYGSMQPVEAAFMLARQLNPNLKRVGVVWNAAESNSVAQLKVARVVTAKLGIELLEANAENSGAVNEGAASVISRGAEAIWSGGDVTVLNAIDAVLASAKRARIPVFTSIPPTVDKGALFDLGADYKAIGQAVGELAADVLDGKNPADVPVENLVPEMIAVNTKALTGLKGTWRIPDDVLARATIVIDESGRRTRTADQAGTSARAQGPLARKMWIDLLEYLDTPNVEISREGFFEGLKRAGLVQGRDFEVRHRNAQGDIATLNTMVDAAVTERTDVIVASTTPALQMALRRGRGTRTVFMLVANPMLAGAGKTEADHLPHVTGAYIPAPHEEALAILKRIMPATRRIGTLFVPAEVNSVFYKEELEKAAKALGMTVESIGVSTSGDIPDAALALGTRKLDVITQISDNLNGASFTSIAEAAKRYKLPLVSFAAGQAEKGSMFTISRDYYDGGVESGEMTARVLRGENPATIPFKLVTKITRIYNTAAAAKVGVTIPADLLAKADQVIR